MGVIKNFSPIIHMLATEIIFGVTGHARGADPQRKLLTFKF